MSQTNRCSIRYARNPSFGTRPSPVNAQEVLRTDANFEGVLETVESEAVRPDRMVQGLFEVGRGGTGSFTGELAFGQFDDWLEDILCGTRTSPISLSATDIDFANADNSINTAGAVNFLTAGVVAGMNIYIDGSSANSGLHEVQSVSATKIVSNRTITTEAAGPTITIKNSWMLRNGTVERSNTLEEAYLDAGLYFVYDDVRASRLELAIAPKSIIKGTFGFVCRDFSEPAGATVVDGTLTAPNANLAFNTTKNVQQIEEGGSAVSEIITNLSLSIDNGVEALDGVGYETAARLPYRKQRITATVEYYLSSTLTTTLAKYRNQTETSLKFVLNNGSPGFYYVVTLKAAKYTRGTPRAGAQEGNVLVPMPFTAYAHADGYQIQIDAIDLS